MEDRPRNLVTRRGRYLAQRKRNLPRPREKAGQGPDQVQNNRLIRPSGGRSETTSSSGTSSSDGQPDSSADVTSGRQEAKQPNNVTLKRNSNLGARRHNHGARKNKPRPTGKGSYQGLKIPPPQLLPDDHPLVKELHGLNEARANRRKYWFKIARRVGDDCNSPTDPNFLKFEEEERIADEKSQDLAVLIAFAQRGLGMPPTTFRRHTTIPDEGRQSKRLRLDEKFAHGASQGEAANDRVRNWITEQQTGPIASSEDVPAAPEVAESIYRGMTTDHRRVFDALQGNVEAPFEGALSTEDHRAFEALQEGYESPLEGAMDTEDHGLFELLKGDPEMPDDHGQDRLGSSIQETVIPAQYGGEVTDDTPIASGQSNARVNNFLDHLALELSVAQANFEDSLSQQLVFPTVPSIAEEMDIPDSRGRTPEVKNEEIE